MSAYETIDHQGFVIKIYPDEDPMNPRKEFDNFGTMVCFHRRYDLGDDHDYDSSDFSGWGEIQEQILKDNPSAFILPLGLLDHSGLHMYVGTKEHWCDPGGWDSGQVGFIFISREEARKEMMVKRLSKKTEQRIYKILEGEVETYDQYLSGDVWGFVVEDEQGEQIDSCWGHYGYDYCVEEAKSAAECARRDNPFLPGMAIGVPA